MFWGKSLNRQLQASTRRPLRSVANMSDMAAILDNLALRETRWLEWQRCSAGGDDEKAHFYFENYCYHMRNALSEQQDKFNAGDKENAEAAVQEALDWLDIQRVSREANADEFEARQKELEGIVNPIILKAFLEVLEAKNGLENYCFTLRIAISTAELQDKFDAGDKENVEAAVQEALDWSRNRLAKKEDFETKQKELEGVVNPILTKVYSKHFA